MPYSCASDVAALTRNLLGPFLIFTESSCPTLKQVNGWLSSGCAIIETRLSTAKYDVPVPTTSSIFGWVKDANTFYAVAMAEFSRTTSVIAPGERTRGQLFYDMFNSSLSNIVSNDLTEAGVSRKSSGKLYAGGISVADAQTIESNTDRIAPRFTRGMTHTPGTINPSGATASPYR